MSAAILKHEWRKSEKALYLPKPIPGLVDIPPHKFITLNGEGNPNSEMFSESIAALYSVAYGIKMSCTKMESAPEGHCDYTVYPLEGIWDITEEARKSFTGRLNKDDLVFKLMIRQPDFVEDAFFAEILDLVKRRKPQRLLDEVQFEVVTDGRCVQMLHIGPFDDEVKSFEQMEAFAKGKGLERKSKIHREIYLSDFRRTAPEKLKTVLRFHLK